MSGLIKLQINLFITFVVFLAIVVMVGRILNQINLSGVKSNSNIESAHRWAAWGVGLSSAGAGLSLLGFVLIFFVGV